MQARASIEREAKFKAIWSRIKSELNIGEQVGATGHLEFMTRDLLTFSVMKGIDSYKRLFFVIRAKATLDDNTNVPLCQVFFQKYNDHPGLTGFSPGNLIDDEWISQGFLFVESTITIQQLEFIEELIEGNEIELSQEKMDVLMLGGSYIKDGKKQFVSIRMV
jgi:hypothetical protein